MPDEQPIHSDDPEAMPYMQQVARPLMNTKILKFAKRSFVCGLVMAAWFGLVIAFVYAQRPYSDRRIVGVARILLGATMAALPVLGSLATIFGVVAWAWMIRGREYNKRNMWFAGIGVILGLASLAVAIMAVVAVLMLLGWA